MLNDKSLKGFYSRVAEFRAQQSESITINNPDSDLSLRNLINLEMSKGEHRSDRDNWSYVVSSSLSEEELDMTLQEFDRTRKSEAAKDFEVVTKTKVYFRNSIGSNNETHFDNNAITVVQKKNLSLRNMITQALNHVDNRLLFFNKKDTWEDIVSCSLSEEELDMTFEEYDNSCQSEEDKLFSLYTNESVYFRYHDYDFANGKISFTTRRSSRPVYQVDKDRWVCWRSEISKEMAAHSDRWDDLVYCSLSEEELDRHFYPGFGGGLPFVLYTETRIYVSSTYDDMNRMYSVSRNPDGKHTYIEYAAGSWLLNVVGY